MPRPSRSSATCCWWEARSGLVLAVTVLAVSFRPTRRWPGGGRRGIGDLAIRYGYYRFQTDVMLITIVLLVVLVQSIQFLWPVGSPPRGQALNPLKQDHNPNRSRENITMKSRRHFAPAASCPSSPASSPPSVWEPPPPRPRKRRP